MKTIRRLFDSLLCTIHQCVDNNIYQFGIKPILSILSGAILACYTIPKFQQKVPQNIIDALDKNISYIVIFFVFFLPVFIALESLSKKHAARSAPNLSQEGNDLLLRGLDEPVETKLHRFLLQVKSLKAGNSTNDNIFDAITKPDEQLAEITRSIHIFFNSFAKMLGKKNIDFGTILFRIEDNRKPVECWCHFPKDILPKAKLLSDKKSLVSQAIKKQSLFIIEDIKKEKLSLNPRLSTHCSNDTGSAICYPIKCAHTGKVPFAIRIVASNSFFETEKKALYQKVLRLFEKRILVEYALGEIKSYAQA